MPPQFTREEFQAIQDDFLNTWPIERLKAMTLEEYSNREKPPSHTGLNSRHAGQAASKAAIHSSFVKLEN